MPIILLTARVFDEDIQAVMELGGIEFMNKPFNPRQLVAVLESLVTDPLPRAHSTAIVTAHPVAPAQAGDGPARR